LRLPITCTANPQELVKILLCVKVGFFWDANDVRVHKFSNSAITNNNKKKTFLHMLPRLKQKLNVDPRENAPQILMGASISTRLDCWRKISLETEQSWRISVSISCTCFPARTCRYSNSLSIMSSSTAGSIVSPFPFPPKNPTNGKNQKNETESSLVFALVPLYLFLLLGSVFSAVFNTFMERTLFEMWFGG
jgi:hypothetical protein